MFPNGASPYGVLDMSGNVWEWCLTDYENPAADAKSEDLSASVRRVVRGGSWLNSQVDARAACRDRHNPNSRLTKIGFRVVVVVPSS
jgi:formylglycine-generating enzyme required for sulfatase activity